MKEISLAWGIREYDISFLFSLSYNSSLWLETIYLIEFVSSLISQAPFELSMGTRRILWRQLWLIKANTSWCPRRCRCERKRTVESISIFQARHWLFRTAAHIGHRLCGSCFCCLEFIHKNLTLARLCSVEALSLDNNTQAADTQTLSPRHTHWHTHTHVQVG